MSSDVEANNKEGLKKKERNKFYVVKRDEKL